MNLPLDLRPGTRPVAGAGDDELADEFYPVGAGPVDGDPGMVGDGWAPPVLGDETAAAVADLESAMARLVAALDGGELWHINDAGLVELLRRVEVAGNRKVEVDRVLLPHCHQVGLAGKIAARNPAQLLQLLLLVSGREARQRVLTAEAVGERLAETGTMIEPRRPLLAAALGDGQISAEKVLIIDRALTKAEQGANAANELDPVAVAECERVLAAEARLLSPADLERAAAMFAEVINPSGVLDPEVAEDRRKLTIRMLRDGTARGSFLLPAAVAAKLKAVFDPLLKPMPGTIPASAGEPGSASEAYGTTGTSGRSGQVMAGGGDSSGDGSDLAAMTDLAASLTAAGVKVARVNGLDQDGAGEDGVPELSVQQPDFRTRDQRACDALEQVLDRVLRAGDQPSIGGIPATVIIRVDEAVVDTGQGWMTVNGIRQPVSLLRSLAGEAQVITSYCSPAGAVLDQGRSLRIATKAQTYALIDRDGGCSFPGCEVPPEYCERHHTLDWSKGGRTAVNSLTLLCRYHHRYFLKAGWIVRINSDLLPEWVPPKLVDPDQLPRIHARIRYRRRERTNQATLPLAGAESFRSLSTGALRGGNEDSLDPEDWATEYGLGGAA